MTHNGLRCGIYFHPGVSDGGAIQEYADASTRDMARKKRIIAGKIAIVPSAAIRAPNWRELRPPRQGS
jgi:hypothetical protein